MSQRTRTFLFLAGLGIAAFLVYRYVQGSSGGGDFGLASDEDQDEGFGPSSIAGPAYSGRSVIGTGVEPLVPRGSTDAFSPLSQEG